LGSDESRSTLGMAVNKVVNSTSLQSPYTSYHKNDYNMLANSSLSNRNLIDCTSMPNTPTADYTRIPATASRSSLISNSRDRSKHYYYDKV
jgi:hypothetical protein